MVVAAFVSGLLACCRVAVGTMLTFVVAVGVVVVIIFVVGLVGVVGVVHGSEMGILGVVVIVDVCAVLFADVLNMLVIWVLCPRRVSLLACCSVACRVGMALVVA